MKKSIGFAILLALSLALSGCGTTDSLRTVDGNFIEEYNEVSDCRYIMHKDIENVGYILTRNVDNGFFDAYNLYFYIANNQKFYNEEKKEKADSLFN